MQRSDYSGRFHHVVDSLDYGDAVSNQVIKLATIVGRLGFESKIFGIYHNEKVRRYFNDIRSLSVDEKDIIVVHISGYSQIFESIKHFKCTKICVYHNITPADFFPPQSDIYRFCKQGREQLPDVIRHCHYFWGDSQYNLDELIALGAPANKCSVVPICVAPQGRQRKNKRIGGAWLFVGRLAPNKRQADLVDLFAEARRIEPSLATRLTLVGGFSDETYSDEIRKRIVSNDVADCVFITGKVKDEDILDYYDTSDVFVSLSEHEGFGVPLIEAAHHALPVVALARTAVEETLGGVGTYQSKAELLKSVLALKEPRVRGELLQSQRKNSLRFSEERVQLSVVEALAKVLPTPKQFGRVSVVICSYHRPLMLQRCLEYFENQNFDEFEIVVITSCDDRESAAMLDRYADRIKALTINDSNLAKARNLGIEHAQGEIVAFIDDDSIAFSDWLARIASFFNSVPLTVVGVGGPAYFAGSLKFQDEDIWINGDAEIKKTVPENWHTSDEWFRSLLGTNCAYRRDVLVDAKGFDEQFDYFLDESELSLRLQEAGHLILFEPDVLVRHEFAKSHNRKGGYNYNWYTISKNTAYFMQAYGQSDTAAVHRKIRQERISMLQGARDAGKITGEELAEYSARIVKGIEDGIEDAKSFPKRRLLSPSTVPFRQFIYSAHPTVQKPLHICIVTREFPGFAMGGIGTLYYHLASELLLLGHYVTLVAPGMHASDVRQGRFRMISLPDETSSEASPFQRNMIWSMQVAARLPQLAADRPIDVVETALWDSPGLAVGLIPKSQRPLLAVRLVTPVSLASRHNEWKLDAGTMNELVTAERTLLETADIVIPISDSVADCCEDIYGIKRDARWTTIPCGIAYWPTLNVDRNYELGFGDNKLKVAPGSKMISFLGRLEGRKGLDILGPVIKRVLDEDENVVFCFAGRDVEGWEPRIRNDLEPENSARVVFLGEVSDDDREALLHSSYCILFPSKYESFGLVPLEAFVHSVPVIASDAGAIPEVVIDDECGLVVSGGDVDGFVRAIHKLLGDASLRERLSNGAKARIKELSSLRMAQKSIDVYHEWLVHR